MGKNFDENIALGFLSNVHNTAADDEEPTKAKDTKQIENGIIEVPTGYILKQETKSAHIQLLVRPTTKKELQKRAKKEKTSVNNLINTILENYLGI